MTLLIVFQVKCYFFVVLCPAFLTANTWDFIGIDSKCFYLPSKNENFRNNFFAGSRCSYSTEMKGKCVRGHSIWKSF